MNNKHKCEDHYLPREMTISKVINGSLFYFPVPGKYCEICEEEILHSDEVKLLEERIKNIESIFTYLLTVETSNQMPYHNTYMSVNPQVNVTIPPSPTLVTYK